LASSVSVLFTLCSSAIMSIEAAESGYTARLRFWHDTGSTPCQHSLKRLRAVKRYGRTTDTDTVHLITGQLITGYLITGHLITGQLITGYLITGHLITGHLITGQRGSAGGDRRFVHERKVAQWDFKLEQLQLFTCSLNPVDQVTCDQVTCDQVTCDQLTCDQAFWITGKKKRRFQVSRADVMPEPGSAASMDIMAEEIRMKRTLTEEAKKRKGESERARRENLGLTLAVAL
ncbi:hypothetical protein GBF38_006685, partial [Nibea albiflora]